MIMLKVKPVLRQPHGGTGHVLDEECEEQAGSRPEGLVVQPGEGEDPGHLPRQAGRPAEEEPGRERPSTWAT